MSGATWPARGELIREEAARVLDDTQVGTEVPVDICLYNGLVRSSKTITKGGPDRFDVFHEIDGTLLMFDREMAIEMLIGVRSTWDGILK